MTLRSSPHYRLLADRLLDLARTRRLVFVANPGNWGDALIGAGAREFLRHFAIPHQEIRTSQVWRLPRLLPRLAARSLRPTIVYGGNGALAGPYPYLHGRIREMLRGTVDSVVLPSTLPPDIAALGLPPSTQLWRRDETLSRAAAPDAPFCHDMAFFLQAPEVRITSAEGHFFRTDAEARQGRSAPPGSADISAEGHHKTPVAGFFERIGQHEVVHTDRLHVAIAGALLGRQVHLHPNSYGKIQAIYESSIAPHYSHVTFHAS